jgi:hypothetical protein
MSAETTTVAVCAAPLQPPITTTEPSVPEFASNDATSSTGDVPSEPTAGGGSSNSIAAPPQSLLATTADSASTTTTSQATGGGGCDTGNAGTSEDAPSVNPNPNPSSRRVTIGHNTTVMPHGPTLPSVSGNSVSNTSMMSGGGSVGGGFAPSAPLGMMMDPRRGSMGSGFGNMDDFFGARRNSFGFDLGMENFFGGRRDSMDSSTAALDMAILDLSRRRYSAAMGAGGLPPPSHGPPTSDLGVPQTSMGSFGFPPPGMMSSGSGGGGAQSSYSSHDSIAQRQHHLQQQQRELELRQKELEFQRQQLIASMQERSYGGPSPHHLPITGPGGHSGGMPPPYHSHRGSLGGLGGSLGLGSVQSHGSASLAASSNMQGSSQMPASHRTSAASGGSASSSSSQKWWICQVCQSKAFASQDEALAHEAICQEGNHSMPLQYPHDLGMGMGLGMGRNFSMGFGMDSSQRGMNMGLPVGSMIDNSSRGVVSLGMDSSRGGSSMEFDRSRHMSLGMDSSSSNYSSYGERTMSTGPINMFIQSIALSMPSDKDWLTPLHCFVRAHCVEVFTATESDVQFPSKGKRKPIQIGQVGIRCPHCSTGSAPTSQKARERGSVYFPTSISSIYNATMNLLQRHLHSCPAVPDDIMRRYETLKADDARSGTSKRYWIESALSLGLVDTPHGIRHSALPPPPLPTLTRQQETTGRDIARRNSNEYFGNLSNTLPTETNDESNMGPDGAGNSGKSPDDDSSNLTDMHQSGSSSLLNEGDKPYATDFSFQLMDQMQTCVFTEADRLGKRKGLPPGFPGLACRHCFGGYGAGRFFPSTIKTLSDTSKTLNVLHNHMMRCRKCPADVKESLEKLRGSHDDERAKMKFGSQKAFFGRIWERLHGNVESDMQQYAETVHRRMKRGKRNVEDDQHNMLLHGYAVQHLAASQGTLAGLEALAAASSPSKRQKM